MAVPPGFHMVMVLLNHHAKFDAGFAIAMIAQLVHANHLGFARVLREGRARDKETSQA